VAYLSWDQRSHLPTELFGERDKPWEVTRPGALDRLCDHSEARRNCQYLWIKIFYVAKGSPEVLIGRVVG